MSHQRHRGFFIIWGSRNRITDTGRVLDCTCPHCHRPARLVGKLSQRWFTLYFIPISPKGTAIHFSECLLCHFQFALPIDRMKEALGVSPTPAPVSAAQAPSQAAGQSSQHIAGVTVRLAANPADAASLAWLMQMYLHLNRPADVINLSIDYPTALNASDACMTFLAHACITTNQTDTARQWLHTALNKNPANNQARALLATLPVAT